MKLRLAPVVFAGLLAALGLLACKKSSPAEGPGEQAGKSVDNAASKTKSAVKKGANDTAEAVEDVAEAAKKKTK